MWRKRKCTEHKGCYVFTEGNYVAHVTCEKARWVVKSFTNGEVNYQYCNHVLVKKLGEIEERLVWLVESMQRQLAFKYEIYVAMQLDDILGGNGTDNQNNGVTIIAVARTEKALVRGILRDLCTTDDITKAGADYIAREVMRGKVESLEGTYAFYIPDEKGKPMEGACKIGIQYGWPDYGS